jgi:hypothetical protein
MEPCFELRFTADYKMTVENLRKYGVGPRIPTVIAFWAMLIILICFSYLNGTLARFCKVAWIIAAIELVVFFLPHYFALIGFRAIKKKNAGKLPEAVITFSDNIVCQSGENQFTYDYADFIGAVHLKYSYKLRFTNRRSLLLNVDAFTIGNFSEFKQFLRLKYPDFVIPE